MNEILKTEQNYVENLNRGINLYCTEMTSSIKEQYNDEFSDIEKLYMLHKNTVYPTLMATNKNLFEIATIFHKLVAKDQFYCYIKYGIHKPLAEEFVSQHEKHFDEISKINKDILGVEGLLYLPIQRLPQYKLLFGEIIKVNYFL